jgi:dTDP-4-dehydrorhamnose reductase/intein/homing endonuclease
MKIVVLGSTGMLGSAVGKYMVEKYGEDNVYLSYRNEDVSYGKNKFYFNAEVPRTMQEIPECDYLINCIGVIKPFMAKNMNMSIYLNALFPTYLSEFMELSGVKTINITTDCFLPGTKVLTEDGYKLIQNLDVGENVFTHKNNKKKIYKFLNKYVKEKIYCIKTLGNDIIRCTKNHPFFLIERENKDCPDLSKTDWVKAKDIKVGNLVAIPKIKLDDNVIKKINLLNYSDIYKKQIYDYSVFLNDIKDKDINIKNFCEKNNLNYRKIIQWKTNLKQIPRIYNLKNEVEINEDFMWFLGLFVAEGWCDNKKGRKTITISLGDEPDLINKTISIVKDQIGVRPFVRYLKKQKGCQITFTHQLLSEMIAKDFYSCNKHYSHNKRIPTWVSKTGEKNINNFLKGYIEGDGCFFEDTDKSCFISMSSVSEDMIDSIKLLFMKLGILPSKNIQMVEGKSIICGRVVNVKNKYNLTISGEQIKKALNMFNINSLFVDNVIRYQRFYQNDEYWFVPVTEIDEEYYEGIVYNLEVEDDHSYLINGCLSAHNCVFSGKEGKYTEESQHDALDDYGKSKSLGEHCQKFGMLIRTSIIGEEIHKNASLIEWIKSQKGKEINGFTNHLWNGITTKQYAKICSQIIDENLYEKGLFHVFSDVVNKLELASFVNEKFDLGITIKPFETENPCDRTMSTVKDLNSKLTIPTIKEQIENL